MWKIVALRMTEDDSDCVRAKVGSLGKFTVKRRLRVAILGIFQGCVVNVNKKQLGEYLVKDDIYVVAGQESWEKEGSRIHVDGYKWFGKSHSSQTSQRGEGRVGVLLRGCLVSKV